MKKSNKKKFSLKQKYPKRGSFEQNEISGEKDADSLEKDIQNIPDPVKRQQTQIGDSAGEKQ